MMGSVRSATHDDGLNANYYDYDVFGKPFGETSDYGYVGKPYDPVTGLSNYGYRDYSPKTARFTTVDPIRDGHNWYAYCSNDPINFVDLWGLSAGDVKQGYFESESSVSFIIVRSEDSNRSTFDRTQRGLDRIEFKNFETGDNFVLFDAQTYVSYFNSDGELAYPVGNTISPFSEFALQYLGNNQEAGQSLYNKQGSNYKGPVFNVQNAQLNGGAKTNDLGQIPGDSDTAPIRVHSNFQLSTDREVPLASGGCPMYNSKYTDSFVEFLERNNVKPGDVMKGYIREYFYP